MDNILIATDFSSAAQNAFFYGYEMARDTGAEITLLHVYQSVFSTPDYITGVTEEELRDSTNAQLLQQIYSLSGHSAVTINCRAERGNPSEVITKVARQTNADFIIVGMKGSGQTARRLFGSTAISLSRNATIPIIVVPEEAWYTTPKVLAFTNTSYDSAGDNALDTLKDFARFFHSRLYVVSVIENELNDHLDRLFDTSRFKRVLKELDPSFEFVYGHDIVDAMNKYVSDNYIDMVIMVGQHYNFLERIFLKSEVKEMLFEAEVPVLVLPGAVNSTNKLPEEAVEIAEIY